MSTESAAEALLTGRISTSIGTGIEFHKSPSLRARTDALNNAIESVEGLISSLSEKLDDVALPPETVKEAPGTIRVPSSPDDPATSWLARYLEETRARVVYAAHNLGVILERVDL